MRFGTDDDDDDESIPPAPGGNRDERGSEWEREHDRGNRDGGRDSVLNSLISEMSNLKNVSRLQDSALRELQKRVEDLIAQGQATPAPTPGSLPPPLGFHDLITLQDKLERLAEDIAQAQKEHQQKLDEFYQLVPMLIRYSWERWLLATLLMLCLLSSTVGTIYILRSVWGDSQVHHTP